LKGKVKEVRWLKNLIFIKHDCRRTTTPCTNVHRRGLSAEESFLLLGPSIGSHISVRTDLLGCCQLSRDPGTESISIFIST